MNTFIRSASLGCLLVVASVPAYANIDQSLGTLMSGTQYSISDSNISGGQFTDIFRFAVGGGSNAVATVQTSFATTSLALTNLAFNLYSSTNTTTPYAMSTVIQSSGFLGTPTVPGFGFGFVTAMLSPGSYLLQVSGTSGGAANYSGQLSVAAVPLPASLPMFGAALLSLAGLGYVLGRKREASDIGAAA